MNTSDSVPPNLPTDPPSAPSGNWRRNWWLFILVLLAPAALTFLSAKSEDLSALFMFLGSAAAGLYCGVWTANRVCRTKANKVGAVVVLAPVFAFVSFLLSCAGCAMGGGELNMH